MPRGRQPLPRGSYGNITVREVRPGRHEARCTYRNRNGAYSRPSCTGKTPAAARNALREKLTDMKHTATTGEVNRDTRVSKAIEVWLKELAHQRDMGAISQNTYRTYASASKTVLPYLGELRLWELEEAVDVVSDMVKELHLTMSLESAKKARTVTMLVCKLAIRRRAMTSNPVREIEQLKARNQEEAPRRPAAGDGEAGEDFDDFGEGAGTPAMSIKQITEMQTGLRRFCDAKVNAIDGIGRKLGKRDVVWTYLPDLSGGSLSTGVRPGELLALAGADVQPYEKNGERRVAVHVRSHLVWYKGQGWRRVPGRKSNRPPIRVRVAPWAEEMWLRRAEAAGPDGPLFPNFLGGWMDQNNLNKQLRIALDEIGFDWVSAKVWRKTVGVLMRRAGHSAEDVAARLGNTRAVAERHYMAEPPIIEAGVEALAAIKPAYSAAS